MLRLFGPAVVLAAVAAAVAPARRVSGPLPTLPPDAPGWTEAVLELNVDAAGQVSDIRTLESTPSAADTLSPTLVNWRFAPATIEGRRAASHVLVVAILRPAQLNNDPALGSPVQNLARPSDDVPFPASTPRPVYPVHAVGNAVVLVEVVVSPAGDVTRARTTAATTGFDRVALEAARRWSFRPARRGGAAVQSYAYLVFGFRQPA